jgi:hypothetical protein
MPAARHQAFLVILEQLGIVYPNKPYGASLG